MAAFIVRRLISTIPVLAVVAVIVFLMLRLTPGDPAAVIAGDNASVEQIASIRAKLGLEEPILTQFAIWLRNILTGDFGESYFFKRSVLDLIGQRVGPTVALTTCTLVFAVLVSVPIGVIAAYREGSLIDKAVMSLSVIGFSVPGFVFGYCLIYVFAVQLGWLPVQGYTPIGVDVRAFFSGLVLPSLTLSVGFIALISRITRASVLEVLNEDFVRTARAKGLSNSTVLMRHAFRNAAVPVLTVIGLGVSVLIGGAVITESVFGLPGLGRLTIEAVQNRDFPTIQTLVLLFSVVYVVINLLIDIGYAALDPRIKY